MQIEDLTYYTARPPMEKPSSAALGPWRRLAESAAASVIGNVIYLAGSLIVGSAGAKLLKAPLAKGLYVSAVLFGIYLLGLGAYLTIRTLKLGTRVGPAGSAEAEPPQKLTLRVLDAIAGDESVYSGSQGDVGIYLRVRVVNRTPPAVTVNTWKLDLFHGEEHWRIAFAQNPMAGPEFRRLRRGTSETNKETVGRGFEKKPIDAGASPEGWLRFTVEGVLLHYIFGATFLLRAIDELGNTSSCQMAPGEWLAPVQLNP